MITVISRKIRGGYRIMKHAVLVFENEKEWMKRGHSLDTYFEEFRRNDRFVFLLG